MSCAEGSDPDSLKRAIRKSRVVYNRGGADEAPPDTGACVCVRVRVCVFACF
jgi:hypothetical protein